MDRLLGDLQPGVLTELIAPLRKRLREPARIGRALGGGHRAPHPDPVDGFATRRARALPGAVHGGALAQAPRLRHQRRQDGEVIEREVSPQRLVHYRDNWYLDAWCHKRQALRTFGLDAIETAVVMPDKAAKEIGEDTLERHFASGYGIFAGTATQEAVLQFGASSARWVSRETWHPQQIGTPQLDGTYLLKFPYAQEPELVMDILKYGADVQVLAPASLRKAVADKLRAAVSSTTESPESRRRGRGCRSDYPPTPNPCPSLLQRVALRLHALDRRQIHARRDVEVDFALEVQRTLDRHALLDRDARIAGSLPFHHDGCAPRRGCRPPGANPWQVGCRH